MHVNESIRRSAFTLVELLVTVTILVILASVALFAMSGIQQMAKIHRCRAQIKRIHEIIAAKVESLEGRRYPPPGPMPNWYAQSPYYGNAKSWPAFDRLRKIRATMRMELPDRATDVFITDGTTNPAEAGVGALSNLPVVSLNRKYRSFVRKHAKNFTNPNADNYWGRTHGGAECLYMILWQSEVGEASALEFFAEREIGDTDEDGMPEILDPWGKPIRFIRWPSGFPNAAPGSSSRLVSMLQSVPNTATLPPYDRNIYPSDMFDLWDVDKSGFFTFPLIMSSGPDRIMDILVNKPDGSDVNYSEPNLGTNNNPYQGFMFQGNTYRLGNYFDSDGEGKGEDNSVDNIHNHFIEIRPN